MRRSAVVLVVVLAALLVGATSPFASSTEDGVEHEPVPGPDLVRPSGGESGFWPYLSSRPGFERRSPVNVVVLAETGTVLQALADAREADWQETDETQVESEPGTHAADDVNASGNATGEIPVGATGIVWSRTTGATRYAYVDPGEGEEGRWVEETAQIHDGTYYGHRYHVRIYESPNPDEPWVAMQAHSEHFDWFTLRHRVHGSQAAQSRLESDLMSLRRIDAREDVTRVYLGNGNSKDADGWATFVDLTGILVAGLALGGFGSTGTVGRVTRRIADRVPEADRRRIAAIRERGSARHLALPVVVVALLVGVRLGGIALEGTDLLSMHGIAGALYPVVALGIPVGTYLVARGLERRADAAVVGGGSLAVASWLDYRLLGVDSVPVDVVGQRALLVVALALIAGGAAHRSDGGSRWNGLLAAGTVLWVTVLAGTLLGYF